MVIKTFWKQTKMKAKKMKSLKMKPWKPKKLNWYKDTDKDGVVNIFDCAPKNRRKQGWAHQGHTFERERTTHVRMMSPQKFLRTTVIEGIKKYGREKQRPMNYKNLSAEEIQEYNKEILDRGNVERLKKVIRSRQGKMEVPYLEYDEHGRPTGHEGRHRAKAAEEMGVKLIPVTIARRLKQARDWKHIREGKIYEDGKVYKGMVHKKKKKDWRYDLESEEEVTSSESADIPIQQQREYGEEKPEALQDLDEPD